MSNKEVPSDRLKRYRDQAARARTQAHDAERPDVRTSYLELADSWARLADYIERSIVSKKSPH